MRSSWPRGSSKWIPVPIFANPPHSANIGARNKYHAEVHPPVLYPLRGGPHSCWSIQAFHYLNGQLSVHYGWVFFWRPFFLVPVFFFVGGWCWLELCHFCKLLQEKTRIADEFRVLQPNTPIRALGFCNPTPLLGLRALQPNTPIRALGFCNPTLRLELKCCNPTLLLGLRVLQPNTHIRALGFCNPTLLLGLRVLQFNTSFRA